MTEYFAHVENGTVIKKDIIRGSVYNGKKFGCESPDDIYAQYNLYPQVGEKPAYNDKTHTISGPVYIFNEQRGCVDLLWTKTVRTPEELADIALRNKRVEDARLAKIEMTKDHPTPTTIVALRVRVELLEKIIMADI